MKNLFTYIILILIQTSCGSKSTDQELIYSDIKEVETIIKEHNLPDLSAQLYDNNEEDYLKAKSIAIEQVAKLWNTAPEKISIVAYIKSKDLFGTITAYNSSNSKIVRSNNIPDQILSSFNKDFKCPKPKKNSPVKRSITLAFEKPQVYLRILIEEFK